MLSSTFLREAFLLETWLPSLRSPSFPLHALALVSSFSPRCGACLSRLSLPYYLVLWTDGSVPFPFGKGGSGVLANWSLYGTEATLSFSAGPVCLSFFAETCAILQAICWSRQHQQAYHFFSFLLLCDSCPVLATLSSSPSFLLSQTLWQIWQELFSFLLYYQATMGPRTLVFPGNNAADESARRGALLAPSAIPCNLSLIISHIHSCLFSD